MFSIQPKSKRPFILLVKNLVNYLPHTHFGFKIYQLTNFVYAHRRLPRKNSNLFNDYLFFKSLGDELFGPLIQMTTDKIYAKFWLSSIIGENPIIPTLEILTSTADLINFTAPIDCVIKPAHDSQLVIFVAANNRISGDDIKRASQFLKSNRYKDFREKNYAFLPQRFLVEPLICDPSKIIDYKVFCWKGIPKIVQVDFGRFETHVQNFYNESWENLRITYIAPNGPDIPQPKPLPELLDMASKVAAHFEFCRVDFYIVNGDIKIGELTHVPNRGFGRFSSIEGEKNFSDKLFDQGPK